MNHKKPLALYLHIPFCVRKCKYCDFLSFYASSNEQERYCGLLCREVEQAASFYAADHYISTIFIGGGTPSFISPGLIKKIMDNVRRHFEIGTDAEISMEMNPGTLGMSEDPEQTDSSREQAEKALTLYRRAGINRISIGLQSADDKALRRIGRIHTYEDFLRTYDEVRKAGFDNVNIDMMAALPNQSYEEYMDSLNSVLALSPEHLSCYSLILEEGTPLYDDQAKYHFPDEDTERKMYHDTVKLLTDGGYDHYEISNFAKTGHECRHNITYWRRRDYLGLGLGASSCVDETRWKEPSDMQLYEKMVDLQPGQGASGDLSRRPYIEEYQKLTVKDRMEETFFVGLRMMEGVDTEDFFETFGKKVSDVYGGLPEKLIGEGLLKRCGRSLALTDYGIDISNYVMAQFLIDD